MATWMLYATVVALLTGAAAWAVERATRAHPLSLRWIWAAALVASSAIPLAALLTGRDGLDSRVGASDLTSAAAPAIDEQVSLPAQSGHAVEARRWIRPRMPASPSLPSELDRLAVGGWALLSLLLVTALLQALRALTRARRGWRTEHLDGRDVFVSDALGPALVGVVRPAIVMPRWALHLPAQERELMLAHEEEHRRAGDAPLLLVAALFLVLLPWNAPLWWQLRRLRLAVEVDCDQRVLRRSGDLRRYASLLLEIGRRRTSLPMSVALAEPASFLERRIRTMTTRPRPRYVRSLALLLAAGALIAAAWGVEQPVAEQPDQPAAERPDQPGAATAPTSSGGQTGGAADMSDAQSAIPEPAMGSPSAAEERTGRGLASGDAVVPAASSEQLSEERPTTPPPPAATQEVAQIRGRVTDLATGQALADARLYLVGTNLAAISSNAGTYVLGNVPVGTHEMRVERVGYTPLSRHVALTDGAVLETDFAMQAVVSAPANAGAVARQGAGRISGRVVDANGDPVRDVQVYLVGANLGAITRQNGAYLLLNVPAGTYTLRAQRVGVGTVEQEVTVPVGDAVEVNFQVSVQPPREDARPIIYIDGVRVSPPPGGGGSFEELVRPEDIERIEVMKGSAATARFGPDAAAGVILVYKKKPQPGGSTDATPPLDPQSLEHLRGLGLLRS